MNYSAFLSVIATLFCLMLLGFFLGKIKILDEVASKKFSRLILTVAQPCLIVSSLTSKSRASSETITFPSAARRASISRLRSIASTEFFLRSLF